MIVSVSVVVVIKLKFLFVSYDRMSSYFDYFYKNNLQLNDEIKGTCYSMCPPEEVKMREVQKLVHLLEVVGKEKKMVKCYCRSAADSYIAKPRLLRPYPVLARTVQYLLLDVTKREDVSTSVVYDFVNDRLRAVRQDMTIQRLPPEDCVKLLEPMVRFYVYYGYILSNSPLNDYDPVLNKKHLVECIKLYLGYCDNIIWNTKVEVSHLTGAFNNLNMQCDSEYKLSCDQELIECLYILCNLDSVHPLYRYNKMLDINLKSKTRLKLAYEIAIANLQGNFIKVCRLMDKLCLLTYCAVFTYLPVLQRQALQVISHAYHSKRLTVPSGVIANWLKFKDQREAEDICHYYGLKVENGAILLNKTDIKTDVGVHQLRVSKPNKSRFDIEDLSFVFTYTDN